MNVHVVVMKWILYHHTPIRLHTMIEMSEDDRDL